MIDKRASRVGATLTALLLVAYAVSGLWPLIAVVVADYVVRVFTPYRAPLAVLAGEVTKVAGIDPAPMNKGPKIFAWRLGFIMAVASLALVPFSLTASIVVAIALVGFNLLDGVFNFCVGCAIYTYIVLPRFGPATAKAR